MAQNYLRLSRFSDLRNFPAVLSWMRQNKLTSMYALFLLLVFVTGIIGPIVAPYGAEERVRDAQGSVIITGSPTFQNPLGTTYRGNDVFSRLIIGARPTVITGILGGTMIISIGLTIGMLSGYLGGQVDNVLMRFTDFVFGVPLIPFAIVLLALLGIGFYSSIAVIGLVLWRSSARVIRSQVLQIKERPFILAARASGASSTRIMIKHIFPNIAPMAALYMAFGVGGSILIQAGLVFIGVSDPFTPSWGVMIRNAYQAGAVADSWYWSLPPGILISFTVLSTFMLGRKYEEIAQEGPGGGERDEALVNM